MADKAEKSKKAKAKPKKDEKGVLAALPSTRPERIGTRRTGTPVAAATQTASAAATSATATKSSPAKPARSTSATPAKSSPARATKSTSAKSAKSSPAKTRKTSYPRTSPATKTPAATAKSTSRPTAARRKAAAPRTFEPTQAAEEAAGAADERAFGVETEPRPRAVREAAPKMGAPRPGRADEPTAAPSPESGRPSGVELVTTAVQAAGELTQIGLTIGGRIIKRAVDRLPKP
jgi:hypothetical protein